MWNNNDANDRVHYPTCQPCLGHGFNNYDAGAGLLNCGLDGAIAVLEPESRAAITKSVGVTVAQGGSLVEQADLPTHGGFKALQVRKDEK